MRVDCPTTSSESGQIGLLRRAEKASAASGCPIDFQQTAQFEFLPKRRAQQRKEPGETVAPLAQPGAEAQQDIQQQRRPHLPAHRVDRVAQKVGHQTLWDNVALLDDELLQQINARIAAAGREVFAKRGGAPLAALEVKVDTYVLETDVHFPTDLNLLWDAGRKCADLIVKYGDQLGYALPGWRKAKEWRRQLKGCERIASHTVYRGGPNKEARVKHAVRDYLAVGRELSAKVQASLLDLWEQRVDAAHWEALAYFHRMLDKHLDLAERRLLQAETIPAHEKVFSLFEPHTEWIQKGKQRPNVELGHRLLIATDQHQLIQNYDVPVGGADVDQSIPVADRLLGRYGAGSLASLSFDKGFTRTEDRELLSLYVPVVVMPKRGKKTAAELELESDKKFVALRQQHSAVESEINSLEHHGLNQALPSLPCDIAALLRE